MDNECMKDNSSEMQKKLRTIASEAIRPMLAWSDKGEILTPLRIGEIQERVQRALEQVHYGFHPLLDDEKK